LSFLDALPLVAEDGLDSLLAEINAAREQKGGSVRPEALADLEMLLEKWLNHKGSLLT
jgi:hypothetical protein